MNRPGIIDAEFSHVSTQYFVSDSLPETLFAFLGFMSKDFAPEMQATAAAFESWLLKKPNRPEGTLVSIETDLKLRQSLRMIEYQQQGHKIRREAWPDILLMQQYLLESIDAVTAVDRDRFNQIVEHIEAKNILDIRISRKLVRSSFSIVLS